MIWKLMLHRDSLGTYRSEDDLRQALATHVAGNGDLADELYVLGFFEGELVSTLKCSDILGGLAKRALIPA